ncbi:MAG: urease accessory protein UreE [Tidjanibacter sp.]|nr:urease accessory protein UreE [Tidjanibacter sp.]
MKIYTQIVGNTASPHWAEATQSIEKEYIDLDHWSAQKSRLVATGSLGNTYAISLDRGRRLNDGDIIYYSAQEGRAVVIRIALDEVMIVTLDPERMGSVERLLTSAVELGHALGNQHWPAVVRGAQVYVPLSIDRKVMESVMKSHPIEGIEYEFRPGSEIIPYLSPHELRRLFGGTTEHYHHDHQHNEHHRTHSDHKIHAHKKD